MSQDNHHDDEIDHDIELEEVTLEDGESEAHHHGTELLSKEHRAAKDEVHGDQDNAGHGIPTNERPPWWNMLLFSYLSPLIKLGAERPLMYEDLPDLLNDEESRGQSGPFLEALGQMKQNGQEPTVFGACKIVWNKVFWMSGIIKFVNDITLFGGPLILHELVSFLHDPAREMHEGIWYALAFLILGLSNALAINRYFYNMVGLGMRIRAAIVSSIYQKALRQSVRSRQGATVGQVVNLMSNDAQKVSDFTWSAHQLWSAPLQIAVFVGLLINFLGVSALVGIGVLLVFFPINGFLMVKMAKLQRKNLENTDQRVKIVNEILQGIRVIKMYAWEEDFVERVFGIRGQELTVLKKRANLQVMMMFSWTASPLLVSVTSFATYAALGNELTPEVIFTSLALFTMLRFPLMFLPMVLNGYVNARVSAKRINKFLNSDDMDNRVLHSLSTSAARDDVGIHVRDVTLDWNLAQALELEDKKKQKEKEAEEGQDKDEESEEKEQVPDVVSEENEEATETGQRGAAVQNVSFDVEAGELLMIIGSVGCGKSSLLSGILGEIPMSSGEVNVRGSIAYVNQQAWIQNATVRDNIIFGKAYDEKLYRQVIKVACLEQDLEMLPSGDMTEIGERGINLSGGQKQRVSIARAAYAGCDIYLFDDPLSAVDAHVGKHIFNECINGFLKEKTVVLVTHQLQFLQEADNILVLEEGKQICQGTYEEVVATGMDLGSMVHTEEEESEANQGEDDEESGAAMLGGKTDRMSSIDSESARSRSVSVSSDKGGNKTSQSIIHKDDKEKKTKEGELVQKEERETGSVALGVYLRYMKSAGNIGVWLGIVLLLLSCEGGSIAINMWLALWSADQDVTPAETNGYIEVYLLLTLAVSLLMLIRGFVINYSGIRASTKLHKDLMESIVRAPTSFFDVTPIGRILNRFSKDIQDIDTQLMWSLWQFMNVAIALLGVWTLITFVTPFFAIPLVGFAYLYYKMQHYYRQTSRELKRLDSVSKSPIFNHFSETLAGLSTIRAFAKQDEFKEDNLTRIDNNLIAYWASMQANRWLSVRLELIGNAIVFFAALFAILSKDTVDPSLAGLSITYSLTSTGVLNWTVRMAAEVEMMMNSVERVEHYTNMDREAEPIIQGNRPEASWPRQGAIDIKNIDFRYRPELDNVLHGVDLKINAHEKIGIVGRTGAGKSSLIYVLFRMAEIHKGEIEIDGINIHQIGLKDLRSKLSIIPQEPVMFTGTIRSNLDPFSKYKDADLWEALEKAHMKASVADMADKLETEVVENGENFSVGQRQLICLARALLKKATVLVLDEATAAVDNNTDRMIQETIRREFGDCTVLTIAHRLNTIMDSDKILVMDSGRVAEFDAPATLLSNPKSMFLSMVEETGPSTAEYLKKMASGELEVLDALDVIASIDE